MNKENIVLDNSNTYKAADAMIAVTFRELSGVNSKGVISNIHISDKISFSNYGDMLLKIEQIYDLLGMRETSGCLRGNTSETKWQKRTLDSVEDWRREEDEWQNFHLLHTCRDPVVYVQTLYWQNYSWQGYILGRGYKDRIYYRSALELLHIIDNIIRGK
ncbi:hypothetical protein MCG44_00250 [Lawsonibacter sp. OA9]|uniref:hypothetical protein n=1 Tax=Oscillospiraceae TaxID=216572 RepID=UPI001F0615FC|nr:MULTISPECIES: hypothetical protein [Oscillospiraceae]MCH1978186.1 hypothetical protein [Lawsonibacter sp. OA9]MCH1981184.1 hypothetical protein [Ruminococcus sp. OA3]